MSHCQFETPGRDLTVLIWISYLNQSSWTVLFPFDLCAPTEQVVDILTKVAFTPIQRSAERAQEEAARGASGGSSRRKRHDTHDKRDRGAEAGRAAARGGGGGPRDADVRALRKQLAEMQRKTTAKSAETPETRAESSSLRKRAVRLHGYDRRSGKDAHVPGIEDGSSDRKSAMVRSYCRRRSRRLRNGKERDRKAVEAATTKRDQLQLSQQGKASSTSCTRPPRSDRSRGWCPPRTGARRSWKRWVYSQEATLNNSRSP